MKSIFLTLLMAACAAAASSQSLAHPATNAASAALKAASVPKENCSTANAGIALPASIPPVQGNVQSVFALRYQDYVIGTGAEAAGNLRADLNFVRDIRCFERLCVGIHGVELHAVEAFRIHARDCV